MKEESYEARERKSEEEEVGGALVATDFAQGNGAGFVSASFADLGFGWVTC